MLSTIKTLIYCLGLIPQVIGLVKEVEAPGVAGSTKKSAVMTLLSDTLTAVQMADPVLKIPAATITGVFETVIDSIVGVLNILGILPATKTATVAVATAEKTMTDTVYNSATNA
jgi:hypothetical protein